MKVAVDKWLSVHSYLVGKSDNATRSNNADLLTLKRGVQSHAQTSAVRGDELPHLTQRTTITRHFTQQTTTIKTFEVALAIATVALTNIITTEEKHWLPWDTQ